MTRCGDEARAAGDTAGMIYMIMKGGERTSCFEATLASKRTFLSEYFR